MSPGPTVQEIIYLYHKLSEIIEKIEDTQNSLAILHERYPDNDMVTDWGATLNRGCTQVIYVCSDIVKLRVAKEEE